MYFRSDKSADAIPAMAKKLAACEDTKPYKPPFETNNRI